VNWSENYLWTWRGTWLYSWSSFLCQILTCSGRSWILFELVWEFSLRFEFFWFWSIGSGGIFYFEVKTKFDQLLDLTEVILKQKHLFWTFQDDGMLNFDQKLKNKKTENLFWEEIKNRDRIFDKQSIEKNNLCASIHKFFLWNINSNQILFFEMWILKLIQTCFSIIMFFLNF
jgi:hypothetical protein